MLRRILADEDPRVWGRELTVENFGGAVTVKLYRGSGKMAGSWTVENLLLLDPSIVEIEPRGVVSVKAVVPRVLTSVYDAETDSLRVAEVEPQSLIPG
jgi:hypothetical protein